MNWELCNDSIELPQLLFETTKGVCISSCQCWDGVPGERTVGASSVPHPEQDDLPCSDVPMAGRR